MINPNIIRAAVYAGIISNIMAIIVLLISYQTERLPKESFDLGMWILAYWFHRKRGTW